MRIEWQDPCWELLDDVEERQVWQKFAQIFQFEPRVHFSPSGIREPLDSVTFDITDYYTSEDREMLERELNERMFNCFKMITKAGEFIYALDWQHDCYKVHLANFDVHTYNDLLFNQNGLLWTTEDGTNYYLISIIPDGDYSIFLTQNMTNGLFGHPWQHTICVFGTDLLRELNKNMPTLLNKLFHKNTM